MQEAGQSRKGFFHFLYSCNLHNCSPIISSAFKNLMNFLRYHSCSSRDACEKDIPTVASRFLPPGSEEMILSCPPDQWENTKWGKGVTRSPWPNFGQSLFSTRPCPGTGCIMWSYPWAGSRFRIQPRFPGLQIPDLITRLCSIRIRLPTNQD